jgi:hypothetical protein
MVTIGMVLRTTERSIHSVVEYRRKGCYVEREDWNEYSLVRKVRDDTT